MGLFSKKHRHKSPASRTSGPVSAVGAPLQSIQSIQAGIPDMSLFGAVRKGLVGAVGGFLTGGPTGAILGAAGGLSGQSAAHGISSLPAVSRLGTIGGAAVAGRAVVRTAGRAVSTMARNYPRTTKYAKIAGTAAAWFVLDEFGNRISNKTGQVIRPRRMNVLNGRAAARAIRRVKGARKMLQKIERQLPKARAPNRRPSAASSGSHMKLIRNS